MEDDGGNRDAPPVADHRQAEDSISSLPDEILQHILSLIPTKLAIRTSILSKRWRARKMMTLKLCTSKCEYVPHINKWIELAMSRNVENLLLDFGFISHIYNIPGFFYINSSVKQLSVELSFHDMIPRCSVSWTSLKKLYLGCCKLSDETLSNILSGCPILESLTLYFCDELMVLDLTKSPRLRILDIHRNMWVPGPTQIVAPHIHCLRLINSHLSCTFVDVSSLTEAKLDIGFCSVEHLKASFIQDMVLKMLEKLHNVEKLTIGANFLKILSIAEIRGVPFPMFKAKTLAFETMITPYVIPGIVRMIQNSPDLKNPTVHTKDHRDDTISEDYLDKYLDLHGLNLDQYCVFGKGFHWNLESKHVASFMKLMLNATKTS